MRLRVSERRMARLLLLHLCYRSSLFRLTSSNTHFSFLHPPSTPSLRYSASSRPGNPPGFHPYLIHSSYRNRSVLRVNYTSDLHTTLTRSS
ncbi:hypothetical protein PISMIDRAFT_349274 [Pisolithus microcarpus 441]|uniref:Uncharacterized protein n=1 Tax=Pisolithus microcarpus 441 TaxID=765257 RepID=A0A0C9ZZS8_9AGAM|nr:hypothetical protein BKA83DRAFT_349274 [Pisolithus microcarpus]KIK25308.1 hypothetical protein PISMIDRAFT_349274 [Pisolithus microcarpus 441]